jgi:ATP-binding cassette subfamily B protein
MNVRATLRRLFGLTRPHAGALALVTLFSAAAVALTLYAPILIGRGVDMVLGPGEVALTFCCR